MNCLATPPVLQTETQVDERKVVDFGNPEVRSQCPRIAIIGGGPGGLMTAYLLQKKAGRSLAVTIYEAGKRLGGKILTPQFSLAPVGYEAGAAEFYDYSPVGDDPLKNLIEELGLPISKMGGNAVFINGQLISNLDDIETHLGAAAKQEWIRFHQQARNRMSPTDFYLSGSDESTPSEDRSGGRDSFAQCLAGLQSAALQQFVQVQIHSDLATEPDHTNVDYGLQNYVMNDPAYMQLYGIDGGNQRLPEELARRCQADIRLQHQVRSVRKIWVGPHAGQYEIQVMADDCEQREWFDYVVVALPHDALPHVSFEGSRLQPAMKNHFDHYHHPAHYLRLTLLFRRPFWQGKLNESYCMLDNFGGCCLYDESSRLVEPEYGVLGWLLGGAAAIEYSKLSNEDLFELALDSVPKFLGDARAHFLEGRVHRWLNAVNAIPGGRTTVPIHQRHCPEQFEHRELFVVGDYLYDATLNGVLDSAEYASDGITAAVHRD
ncbi:MAG: FAD-dependent oxidoreductase [Planctomycetaceae bacterium]|nr:FAD-dependent oxidoreductase [Planctomycetaceae bacterium]